jgi:hypothetical protein
VAAALVGVVVGAIVLGSASVAAAADGAQTNRGWDTSANRGWEHDEHPATAPTGP